MKPVAILRFSAEDGPGYFASFLDSHSIPWQLYKLDAGDAVPDDPSSFSGLVLMGGPMSVNDDLAWIPPVIVLIQKTMMRDMPCLGHCLGGQLMSKALGGEVTRNPVKEIGWNPLYAERNAEARHWLGDAVVDGEALTTFQWHDETFSLPAGAVRILTGTACVNQAFVIGKSLGMQCHTEMTPEMIESWCEDWAAENADPSLPSVQEPAEMRAQLDENMRALRVLSNRLYAMWIEGLPLQQK